MLTFYSGDDAASQQTDVFLSLHFRPGSTRQWLSSLVSAQIGTEGLDKL